MPHTLNLVLNRRPHDCYTCEDIVSGRVILESSRSDIPSFVYICFSGVVHSEVKQPNNSQTGGSGSSPGSDKDVLFQLERTFHQTQNGEQFGKKVNYEWPFEFPFSGGRVEGFELPSSGRYHDSKVEYKISAVIGQDGEDMEKVKQKINPQKKPSNFHKTDFGLWARRQIGDVAEQKIEFVQIRSGAVVDVYEPPPFEWPLEISVKHLPSLQQGMPMSEHKGLFHSSHQRNHGVIPFSLNCQITRTVVQGLPFPMLLSVSSPHPGWSRSPPTVTLTKLKIDLRFITIERAVESSVQSVSDVPIFQSKDLMIPLGPEMLDLGAIFSLRLTGEGVTPSINTRLLTRKYHLPTYITIKVGGKSFDAIFAAVSDITILPFLVATGRPAVLPPPYPSESFPNKKKEIHLQHSHLGRISQFGSGIPRPESILEAALTLSRLLTHKGIMHSFPGGSLIRLHAYKPPDGQINDTDFDTLSDEYKILSVFREVPNCAYRFEPRSGALYGDADLMFIFEERKEKEIKHTALFAVAPQKAKLNALQQKFNDHDWIKKTSSGGDEVKLDPIVLFNRRLECGLTRNTLNGEEIYDFMSLERAFGMSLREGARKRSININMARMVLAKYGELFDVFKRIGIVAGDEGKGWEEDIEKQENEGYIEGKADETIIKGVFGGYEATRQDREVETVPWEGKATRRDREVETVPWEGKSTSQDREVETVPWEGQTREWNNAESHRDRNWAWNQSEKERVRRLKREFLESKRAKGEKAGENDMKRERWMEDWGQEERELVGRFEKDL